MDDNSTALLNPVFLSLLESHSLKDLMDEDAVHELLLNSNVKVRDFRQYRAYISDLLSRNQLPSQTQHAVSDELNSEVDSDASAILDATQSCHENASAYENDAVKLMSKEDESNPELSENDTNVGSLALTKDMVISLFADYLTSSSIVTPDDVYDFMLDNHNSIDKDLRRELFEMARSSDKFFDEDAVDNLEVQVRKRGSKQVVSMLTTLSNLASRYPKMKNHRKYFKELAKYREENNELKVRELEDEIVKGNLKLVFHTFNKFNFNVGSFEDVDLIMEGQMGLLLAIRGFDHTRSIQFSTYAVRAILTHIVKFIQRNSYIIAPSNNASTFHYKVRKVRTDLLNGISRNPEYIRPESSKEPSYEDIAVEYNLRHEEQVTSEDIKNILDIIQPTERLDKAISHEDEANTLKDIIPDDTLPTPDELYEQKELRAEINRMLDTLSDREADIVQLISGLTPDNRQWKLDEIAPLYGISKERVRQIYNKALRELQHYGRNKNLIPFMYPDDYL